jgi:ATP-dependent DNA helicase
VPMSEPQREMYELIVKGELAGILADATGSKTQLNNVLMQLRKCSLHPYLHYEARDGAGQAVTDERIVHDSGKLRVLDRMLTELRRGGHKVLIFSQFTTMLDIIEDYLSHCRKGWRYCRIDGSTSLEDRRDQMHDFNNDPDYLCFLLSTRAGGVGINLVSADTVIIFDSDWNPHQDNQAQDRAHRIGQKSDVLVYRLITARSVELKILERANSKRKLERVVCAKQATLDGGANQKLGIDDLKRLLEDDFTGHKHDDVGDLTDETLRTLLDRDTVLAGALPLKGDGYEIVEHKASSIVGSIE